MSKYITPAMRAKMAGQVPKSESFQNGPTRFGKRFSNDQPPIITPSKIEYKEPAAVARERAEAAREQKIVWGAKAGEAVVERKYDGISSLIGLDRKQARDLVKLSPVQNWKIVHSNERPHKLAIVSTQQNKVEYDVKEIVLLDDHDSWIFIDHKSAAHQLMWGEQDKSHETIDEVRSIIAGVTGYKLNISGKSRLAVRILKTD